MYKYRTGTITIEADSKETLLAFCKEERDSIMSKIYDSVDCDFELKRKEILFDTIIKQILASDKLEVHNEQEEK